MNVHGSEITAVEPVGKEWVFYAVSSEDGSVKEIYRRAADHANIVASRSSDGQRLYFQSDDTDVDGGVGSVDLATASETTLVDGRDAPGESRTLLIWSASGKTVYSNLCGIDQCQLDVIDAESGAVRRLPRTFGAIAGSDAFAIGYPSGQGPDRPWRLYDLKSDTYRVVGKDLIAETDDGASLGDERFVVSGWSPGHVAYNIVLVDASTGTERLLATQSPNAVVARLQGSLVSSSFALVNPDPIWKSVMEGSGEVNVISVDTGEVLPSVGAIDVP